MVGLNLPEGCQEPVTYSHFLHFQNLIHKASKDRIMIQRYTIVNAKKEGRKKYEVLDSESQSHTQRGYVPDDDVKFQSTFSSPDSFSH